MKKQELEEIVSRWREQMKKGYLKLAVLFALTRKPLHGYEMIKCIKELSLGLLTPKAGALYPTLKKLEKNGLIKGKWKTQGRKRRVRVYRITRKGKEVFQRAVEKHFNIISASRALLLNELETLGFIERAEAYPQVFAHAIKVLVLKEKATLREKIEALEKLKQGLQRLTEACNTAVANIEERIKELKKEINELKS
jgi:DNA-binding PadR family transcriptional regulator